MGNYSFLNQRMIKHFQILVTFFIALPFLGMGQTDSLESGNKINVLENGILARSTIDQTEKIQQIIDQASEGDTVFFPEGQYLIRTILLKSGVNILCEGIIKHHESAKAGEYSIEKQNSPNPLVFGQGVKNVSISLNGQSKNEGIQWNYLF